MIVKISAQTFSGNSYTNSQSNRDRMYSGGQIEANATMRSLKKRIALSCGLLVVALVVHAVYASDKTVARVTDLTGQVLDVTDGGAKKLRILARVRAGTMIELSTDSNLTLHFSSNRTDLRFFGPTTVTVLEQSAESSNGISAKKEHKDIDISIDLNDNDLGGVIARSVALTDAKITPIQPVNSKIISDRPVEFRWRSEGIDFDSYGFRLFDGNGGLLHSIITSSDRIVFSNRALFQPGLNYRWSVRSVSAGNESAPEESHFTIASVDEANSYYALADLTRGTVSDLVLYALALDQLNLRVESERIWRQLESHHPGIQQER